MLRIHSVLSLASIIALPLVLNGCAGALVVGGLAAAGAGGYEAAQERGVDGSYDDFAVKTGVENAWINADPAFHRAFSVTVYDGGVLLTGDASDPEMKRRAFEIASHVPGVKRIYDEIEVRNLQDGWDSAQDAWITTQVRKDLILEQGVRSGNYSIATVNRSVYLMGSARSQEELDKAAYLARYVPGVKRVISYVEIRSGIPVASQNAPPVSSGGPGGYSRGPSDYSGPNNYSGPSNYSAPPGGPGGRSAPIQVQRL